MGILGSCGQRLDGREHVEIEHMRAVRRAADGGRKSTTSSEAKGADERRQRAR
jgi:hypothetical protein